jgi:hypothetical protein
MAEHWGFSEPLAYLFDLTWPYYRTARDPPRRDEAEQQVANICMHIYERLYEISEQLTGACCLWPRGTTTRRDAREQAVIAAAREWREAARDVPSGIMRPRWMELAERERAARGVLHEALDILDAPDGEAGDDTPT